LQASLANLKKTVDIAHIFESRGNHVRWAADGLTKQGIPFVWSAYGGLASGVGIRRLYRRAYDIVFRTSSIVQSAAGLVAQTHHERNVYTRFGGRSDQIRIIPLAVPWQEFIHLPFRNLFRQQIGLDSAAKLILFVGRIHPTKGLDMLLRAFASLRQKEKAYLAIVGWDHGHLSTIQRLRQRLGLTDAVTFSKPIFGPERLAAYVDADVFAMTPPVYEETSLAALEAAACGTQCVLTRQCEIPGLEEAGGGRIVEYDQAAIEQALLESLRPGVRERRGQRARSLVAERFTMGVIARDHERFYEEILTRRSERRRALA
jgi:glycosyltransferase involved in cell wall biosynthesis